jgi:predicted RNA-binding Zn-ribbon protein involved in translation (DUF1610 family)
MAATLTGSSELTYLSFPIEKTETDADGNVIVYGKATDGSVDSDEQIVDTDWSAGAIADWLKSGANVRVQHNPQRDPAGVGVEVEHQSDGSTWVKSLVVEPVAKTLVLKKALRAYSVGIARPKIVRDAVARGGRIVDGEIVEISLVDRPANKNCGIQLVKSADDGHAEFTGKMFGNSELLTKSAPVEPAAPSAFSPADLAKLLEHRAVAEKAAAAATVEKKDVDPNVGGGTDRDKIPASDFAGRDRSFPIVTPKDVADAAASIGRAGDSNYSPEKLRENITRIAHRKGPEFEARLPESWQEEGSTSSKAENEPDITKGAKDCPKCGKSYHADAKVRKCESCGADLPHADKAEEEPDTEKGVEDPDVEKKTKAMCAGCGANVDVKHAFCPECGNDLRADKGAQDPEVEKGHDFNCLGCGRELDDDEKYCPGCGKQHPGYEGGNTKSSKPTVAPGTDPVPAHREPDGAAVEAFEHDAGLPTDPDGQYLKTITRLKSVGVKTDFGALHDVLCPGFHPSDVAKSYKPEDIQAGLSDTSYWQAYALEAVSSGTMEEATKSAALWQHAETIKSLDPAVLDGLRHEAHKAFRDANPGPANFPSPTELSPSKFKRPYLTAGHADQSPGAGSPAWSATVPSSGMDASSFNRGPLTAGHEAQSPANKSGTLVPVNVADHLRLAAANAMNALHDHISQTFPDLCPMGMEHAAPRPVAAAVKAENKPKKAKAKKHNKAKVEKAAATETSVVKAASVQDPDTATLMKAVSLLAEKVTALSATVDALAELPDPRVNAFKGVGQSPVQKAASPAAVATVAENAERTRQMMISELEGLFRTSPDPAQREAAWNSLTKMRGL